MAEDGGGAVGCVGDSDDEDGNRTKTSSLLPWDRFSSWIHCICIVTFDLELGQALEVSMKTICFLAFTR